MAKKYKLHNDGILVIMETHTSCIPRDTANRDYQQFVDDVREQGVDIVEGADVRELDYVALRTGPDGYASTGEQFDMQYKGTWNEHIQSVKARYPKTMTGSQSIAPLPPWVVEIAEAKE